MNIAAIGVGFGIGYALKADGSLQGLGGITGIPQGLQNAVAIAVGYSQVLALVGDGPPVMKAAATFPTAGSNGVGVSISSQSGRVYRLEYANSLGQANWTALPLAAGTGRTLTLTDASPMQSGQRFYRVRRW
jgi:hypothetical protein